MALRKPAYAPSGSSCSCRGYQAAELLKGSPLGVDAAMKLRAQHGRTVELLECAHARMSPSLHDLRTHLSARLIRHLQSCLNKCPCVGQRSVSAVLQANIDMGTAERREPCCVRHSPL